MRRFSLLLLIIPVCSMPAWALTAEQEAKLLPADGAAGSYFGLSVAFDGDTAVVGALWDDDNGVHSGSAYVFTRTAGVWTEQAKLLPTDGAAGDEFGRSVAVDGNTAIIGASHDDDNGASSGSAYVFTRVGGGWAQQDKLLPSDGALGHGFGLSVALDGRRAVIGAVGGGNGFQTGAAYVFAHISGTTWTERAKLVAADGEVGDWFGNRVALDGDTAVIGAVWDADNGVGSGSAYVFTDTGGVWTEQAKLLASDGAAGDSFSINVTLDGDTAIIGAHLDDDNGEDSGSAYVFTRAAGVWTEQAKLLPVDGEADDQFGTGIALDGDMAIIGANFDDDNGSESGSAYVFTRSGEVWMERAKLLPADGAAGDRFGYRVSLQGNTAIIGASRDQDNGDNSGSAYVFSLVDCSITVTKDAVDTLIWFWPASDAFDVVSGYLSELLADTEFSGAECLGTFLASPVVDTLHGPATGDTRYYLARGLTSCVALGYGESSLQPDPRHDLAAFSPCP